MSARLPTRNALVIGNANYAVATKLKNPRNDAAAMAGALGSLGFAVTELHDGDLLTLNSAVDAFGDAAAKHDVNVFYFAGHGLQHNGGNYLVPVDTTIRDARQIEAYCVSVNRLMAYLEEQPGCASVIILDACRDDPFASQTRSLASPGLAHVAAPAGVLIAYACAPGQTASDGAGDNGLYTSVLLEELAARELSASELFQRVRVLVRKQSQNLQTPWEASSLTANLYLNGEPTHRIDSRHVAIAHAANAIDARTPLLEAREVSLDGESTEGGVLTFHVGATGDVLKITAHHYGESGQATTEYYFRDDEPFFARATGLRYNFSPFYGDALAAELGTDPFDFKKSALDVRHYYINRGSLEMAFDERNEPLALDAAKAAQVVEGAKRYLGRCPASP